MDARIQRMHWELGLAPASPLTTAATAAATLGMATAGPVGEQLADIEKTIGIETFEEVPLPTPPAVIPEPGSDMATPHRPAQGHSPQPVCNPVVYDDPDCGWGVTAPKPFGAGNQHPFRARPPVATGSAEEETRSPASPGPADEINPTKHPGPVPGRGASPSAAMGASRDAASQASLNPSELGPSNDEIMATFARAWAARRHGRPQRVIYASLSFSNAYVANAIVSHPALGNAIKRVLEEGGEIQPAWSNGGLMLHPYDTEDIEQGPPLNMEATHIILSEDDLGALGTALLGIPKEFRPGIFFEGATSIADELLDSDSDAGDGAPKIPEEDLLRNRLGGICQGCGTRGLAGQCEFCGAPTTNTTWHFNSDGWFRAQDG